MPVRVGGSILALVPRTIIIMAIINNKTIKMFFMLL